MQEIQFSNQQIPSPPQTLTQNQFSKNINLGFRGYHSQMNKLKNQEERRFQRMDSWSQKYGNTQLFELQRQEQEKYGKFQPIVEQYQEAKNENNQLIGCEIIKAQVHKETQNAKNQQSNVLKDNQLLQNSNQLANQFEKQVQIEENSRKKENTGQLYQTQKQHQKNIKQQNGERMKQKIVNQNEKELNEQNLNKKNEVPASIRNVKQFSKLLEMSDEGLKNYLAALIPDLADNVKDMTRQQLVQVIKDVLEDGEQEDDQLMNQRNQQQDQSNNKISPQNQKLIQTALKVYPQLKEYINTLSKNQIENLLKEILQEDNKKDTQQNKSSDEQRHNQYNKIPRMPETDEGYLPRRGRRGFHPPFPQQAKIFEKSKLIKKPTTISQIVEGLIIQLPSLQSQIKRMNVKQIEEIYNEVMEEKRQLTASKNKKAQISNSQNPKNNNQIDMNSAKQDKMPIISNQQSKANQNQIQQNEFNVEGHATNYYECEQYDNGFHYGRNNSNKIPKKDRMKLKKALKQNINNYEENKQQSIQNSEQIEEDEQFNTQIVNKENIKKVKSRTMVIVHTQYFNSPNDQKNTNSAGIDDIVKKIRKAFETV